MGDSGGVPHDPQDRSIRNAEVQIRQGAAPFPGAETHLRNADSEDTGQAETEDQATDEAGQGTGDGTTFDFDNFGKDLIPFEFNGYQLTYIVDANGNIWFIATEVCAILGLTNTDKAVSSLDDDEKSTVDITNGTPGNPKRTIINDSGLYSLIMKSRKPGAKKFKRWINYEVLPAIRKTGRYVKTGMSEFEWSSRGIG